MAIRISGGVGSSGVPNTPFTLSKYPITIAPAQAFTVPPGPHMCWPGSGYANLEQYDSGQGQWLPAEYTVNEPFVIDSDGANFRVINRTGCPTGAIIVNTGSTYTNGIGTITVASSAGGSLWQSVVGGAINTSITVTTAGSYNYVPTLVFSAPPAGGIRAAGYAVLAAGAISSVTVTNQGAGYTAAPTITIVPDPRETGTQGGVLTVSSTLVRSGQTLALNCLDPGTAAQTSTPTLSFSGGGGGGLAATVLMNYTVTGFTVTTPGSSMGTSTSFMLLSGGYQSTATAGATNPVTDVNINFNRMARLLGYTSSSGQVIASNTSVTLIDAGWGFQQAPSLYIVPPAAALAAAGGPIIAPVVAATVGGTNDTWFFQNLGV